VHDGGGGGGDGGAEGGGGGDAVVQLSLLQHSSRVAPHHDLTSAWWWVPDGQLDQKSVCQHLWHFPGTAPAPVSDQPGTPHSVLHSGCGTVAGSEGGSGLT